MDQKELRHYPARISVNMLAELTGRDRRTISKKLENLTPLEEQGNASLYDIRAALRMIFDFNATDDNQKTDFSSVDFQPSQEKAKLDFIKRQQAELDLEIARKNLIPKEEIRGALEDVFGACRAKFLGLSKRAQLALGLSTDQESQLKQMVADALTDLSEAKFNERDE